MITAIMTQEQAQIRNIAIIAHVDHGKTTLVDALLKQSNTFRNADAAGTTIMDSNELERERGITIFSKNASIHWKGVKINIVDTPGHADFGGEVERIMHLVDGCLLLVDAKEGPMPQTRFVLRKAIEAGHKIIVVINKIDKKDARPDWVLNKTFDLFVELGASDEQTDFPVIYASATRGVAGVEADLESMKDVTVLFDTMVEKIPASSGDPTAPLQVSVVNLQYDNYKGRIVVGRVVNGVIHAGQSITHINRAGVHKPAKVIALQIFDGLDRVDVNEVSAGEIVAVAGIEDIQIGETIADPVSSIALPVTKIEEPTVKMTFGANTSPFSGKEGQYSTSRNLKERLERELLNDVALRLEPSETDSRFVVSGRGELHLAILIEKMRREGYEFEVSRPQVIFHEEDGVKTEPFESVFIECPDSFAGIVIEKMGKRRGEMKDMRSEAGTTFLEFEIPTRGLIGYRSAFLTDTKGQGILNSLLLGYRPCVGEIEAGAHGSLVSMENGIVVGYALRNLQARGDLFVEPGTEVYIGMVVGQYSRTEDVDVNPCKEKRLSNMRSKGDGVADALEAIHTMTLEACLEYLGDDELLEVTPKNLRMRKTILDPIIRKRDYAKRMGL
ncbi:MAG: GTP-binding protein TypA [Candidatus Uhrbacteria bacterium GW2011_GWE2_46_68]|uniref:Large ribosomal subunit assembly factor BipA n=2 Tax=Candidatus Uhriibacteriota TaxID=1752732 RepID=A0A0G1SGS6_9BACT|nr:MAG: GTP-binding protein TypA [Candidatus Uhrbacteria bacterium GW2011_GWF2_46_218]KKU41308.1 MAG: GTP-binding protein TypA [Candidatus Uhrbacteria bacterium GW2011_GWE2_46_68]